MAANKDATAGPPPGRTIDELARDFALPVSTLRMYQHRGLLPAPERRGRVAYYGDEHTDRLRMLVALQERGFSLAAIKELLDTWQEGRSLDDVLGLGGVGSVWEREKPLVLDPAELANRFPPEALSPELMARTAELGIIRLTADGRVEVPVPRYLDVGTRLMAMGIPATEVIDEYEVLRQACDTLADRFTDLFRQHIWNDLVAAAPRKGRVRSETVAAARVNDIRQSLAELGPLALDITEATLRQALQDAAERFLDEQADALRVTGQPSRAG
jgi:DNA-binding transcriptional MerR regulator